jgi:hypothetical protein
MVDRRAQLVEEPPESLEVGGVEGDDAGRELAADAVQAIGVSRREDHPGSVAKSKPGSFESDTRAVADPDDGLSGGLRFAAHAVDSAGQRFWYGWKM